MTASSLEVSLPTVAVGVLAPIDRPLTYAVPAALAERAVVGMRCVCELGRRRVVGVVLGPSEETVEGAVKPLAAIVDDVPTLTEELVRFLRELADYYFAPIGEVLRLALPAIERSRVKELEQGELALSTGRVKKVGQKTRQVVSAASVAADSDAEARLRGVAKAVLAHLRMAGELPIAHLEKQFKSARPAVKKLTSLGLAEVTDQIVERDVSFAAAVDRDVAPTLNPDQRAAREAIGEAIRDEQGHTFLLFGVTGSGKTEVYLHAIADCLEAGRGALVLVPEISLTPQLVDRFRRRFGDDLAVLHSGLADAERHRMWKRLRNGDVKVAIGARSALFAPVADLGLIVVDEEHDGSFKQEEGVRYHARDMAVLRAHRANAAVVLGSATPSLETVGLTRTGKAVELSLRARATQAELPRVRVVDLRRTGAGPTGNRLISLPLHRAIEETLARSEQAIIFLNRRGFAPSVLCEACGYVEQCPSCAVALTLHRLRRGDVVRCHYCGYEAPPPQRCTKCQSEQRAYEGLGTEKLESVIAEAFPDARVGRLDRDVAAGAKSERILDRMRSRELDVLVGTQMVTKGHDLPWVTLVGVVNADAALSLPDFRATERGFSLLVQVAGRAGRAERPGHVIIQSWDPEQTAIAFATQQDVRGFGAAALEERQELRYPPFSRLALFRLEAVDEREVKAAAELVADIANRFVRAERLRLSVLGPAPAPIPRLRNRYRFRVLLKAADRRSLRMTIRAILANAKIPHRVRSIVDVDPVSML